MYLKKLDSVVLYGLYNVIENKRGMSMGSLTIGKIASLAGVGVETIRFYEREGLIVKPPRKEPAYRQYPEEVIARIRFIKRAKELGFSLKEIKEILSLRVSPGVICENIRVRAEVKITDIEKKIKALKKMKRALVKLTAACRGDVPANQCPILEALEDEKL